MRAFAVMSKYWKSVLCLSITVRSISQSLRLVSVMTTFSSKLHNEISLNRIRGVDTDTTSFFNIYITHASLRARAAYKEEVVCCKLFKERKNKQLRHIFQNSNQNPPACSRCPTGKKAAFHTNTITRDHILYILTGSVWDVKASAIFSVLTCSPLVASRRPVMTLRALSHCSSGVKTLELSDDAPSPPPRHPRCSSGPSACKGRRTPFHKECREVWTRSIANHVMIFGTFVIFPIILFIPKQHIYWTIWCTWAGEQKQK